MTDWVIRLEQVSKQYRLGGMRASLRETLAGLPQRLLRRQSTRESRYLWALRDISFEVRRGEVLGIIGPNGAGKTTLLKLLSNVTYPTTGRIEVNGRVSSLIELGAGFHPELTGRENIYLNGVILGLTRKEIDRRFDEIVEFSGLGRFLDTPVKRYSSGMYVRLGFAVAAHTNPELLLVDEVLAVGDVAFRSKCYERMLNLLKQGVTILFVSHNMQAISRICTRTLVLDRGQIVFAGPPSEATDFYLARVGERPGPRSGSGEVEITHLELFDQTLQPCESFPTGSSLLVRIHYQAKQTVYEPVFGLLIDSAEGLRIAECRSDVAGLSIASLQGSGYVDLQIERLDLTPGVLFLSPVIWKKSGLSLHDYRKKLARILITGEKRAGGLVHLPHRWHLPAPEQNRTS